MQRAGHSSFSTTQGYVRDAENVRVGFGDVFPPLPEPLLGARARPRSGARQSSANRQGKLHPAKSLKNSAERAGFESEARVVKGRKGPEMGAIALTQSDPSVRTAASVEPIGNAPSTVEEALRAAVVLAVEAGEYEGAGKVLALLQGRDRAR
jgi:hypothetical protein